MLSEKENPLTVDSKGSVNEIWHWEGGSRMYDGKPWKAMMESKVKRDAKGNTEEGGERWDE